MKREVHGTNGICKAILVMPGSVELKPAALGILIKVATRMGHAMKPLGRLMQSAMSR